MVDETGGTIGPDAASNEPDKAIPAAAPASAGAAASPPAQPHNEAAIQTDIAKILQEVKLPERRGPEAAKQTEVKQIDTLLVGATPTPEAGAEPEAPAQVSTPQAPQAPEKKAPVVGLHTLKDDLKGVVRDQKLSVVRAVALEQEKRKSTELFSVPPPEHRLRKVLSIAGILSLVGLAALFGVYYAVEHAAPSTSQTQSTSLVFAESSVGLPLDNTTPTTLKASLATARQQTGTLGSITRIVPTLIATTSQGSAPRPATFAEFMTALGAHVPDELLRALSDQFFLGIHTVDKEAPVIIVPVTSYEHAFAGMLAWEATMNGDLTPLFTPVSPYSTDNGIPKARTFTDSVFRNYDVRQLTDDSGQIVLYYSFPTRGILIIAESPYTFTEVLTRLQAQRAL